MWALFCISYLWPPYTLRQRRVHLLPGGRGQPYFLWAVRPAGIFPQMSRLDVEAKEDTDDENHEHRTPVPPHRGGKQGKGHHAGPDRPRVRRRLVTLGRLREASVRSRASGWHGATQRLTGAAPPSFTSGNTEAEITALAAFDAAGAFFICNYRI